MLIEIQCDKFAPEHQIIRFNSGLNTVLGSAGGSNAIGKSTFLWIIDYVFGGESYYSLTDDIKKETLFPSTFITNRYLPDYESRYRCCTCLSYKI